MKVVLKCKCGEVVATEKGIKPRGWQGKGDNVICPKCRKQCFEIRAIRFAVAEIVGVSTEQKNEFYAALKHQQRLTTIAANALLEECRRIDPYPTEATLEAKMPPFKVPSSEDGSWAYQIVRRVCPGLNTGCAASLARAVVSNYAKQRFKSRWLYAQNALSIKYPYPFTIRAQEASYNVRIEQRPVVRDGQEVLNEHSGAAITQPTMLISLPIGKVRYDFRLWKEPKFDPNFEAFKHLVAGGYELRSVEIGWRRLKNRADTDATNSAVQNFRDSGKNKRSQKLQLKLIVQRPKAVAKKASGTMVMRTDRESFLVAAVEEGHIWRLTENRARRQIASLEALHDKIEMYRKERQAMYDDKKFRRRQSEMHRKIDSRLKVKEGNYANWIKNWIENAVAEIVDYARRMNVALVEYNDEEKSFLRTFQWFTFKTKLSDNLTRAGIEFLDTAPKDEESIQRSGEGKPKNRAGTATTSGSRAESTDDSQKQSRRSRQPVTA
jgi:hypothetical protein